MSSSFNLTILHLAYPPDRVNVTSGLLAAQAPFLAARGRSGDTLVLHLALDGTAPLYAEEYKKLVKSLVGVYYKTSGSSTFAMRTVAEQLNGVLVKRNQRGASRSLQLAGLLTQAVFRNNQLYLSQCGPTHAFLIQSTGLSHYHLSNLAWRGLGFNRVPEIRYQQVNVNPGDVLLICADPPTTWTANRLTQLLGLSLEEMASILVAQAREGLNAGLIYLEPGSGKLNIISLESIEPAHQTPEKHDRFTENKGQTLDSDALSSERLNLEEQAGSRGQEQYSQGILPFEYNVQDESIEISSDQAISEELPSDIEKSTEQIPSSIVNETERGEENPAFSFRTDTEDVDISGMQDINPLSPDSGGEDSDGQSEAQGFSGNLRGRWNGLPRWVWRLVVGMLLVGIIGFVYLISQGLQGYSPGVLGLNQQSDTLQPTNTQFPTPSATRRPSKTSTALPSPTFTPLPPTATHTASPTPKYRIGSTEVSPADGMVQGFVPAGTFLMGADEDESNALRDERPQHIVNIAAFWMDQTEVTNGQYAQCVAAGKCRIPFSLTSFTRNPYYNVPEFSDYPVVFVSWQDAQDYCQWAGRRLPTEAEWEKAARGQDSRMYPWGSGLDCDFANFRDCLGDTAEVSRYPSSASPYGVLNMAGNVWEWVSDWYSNAYYEIASLDDPLGPQSGIYKVIRGGSWYDDAIYLRTSSRYWYYPENARFNVGFRCAISEAP